MHYYDPRHSVTSMLQDLQWQTLCKRRAKSKVIMLYRITHGFSGNTILSTTPSSIYITNQRSPRPVPDTTLPDLSIPVFFLSKRHLPVEQPASISCDCPNHGAVQEQAESTDPTLGQMGGVFYLHFFPLVNRGCRVPGRALCTFHSTTLLYYKRNVLHHIDRQTNKIKLCMFLSGVMIAININTSRKKGGYFLELSLCDIKRTLFDFRLFHPVLELSFRSSGCLGGTRAWR